MEAADNLLSSELEAMGAIGRVWEPFPTPPRVNACSGGRANDLAWSR